VLVPDRSLPTAARFDLSVVRELAIQFYPDNEQALKGSPFAPDLTLSELKLYLLGRDPHEVVWPVVSRILDRHGPSLLSLSLGCGLEGERPSTKFTPLATSSPRLRRFAYMIESYS
jgi:hypothetical protein